MFSKFNEEAQKVLVNAKKEMLALKHSYVGSEHLFLALLSTSNSFSEMLKEYGVTYDKYRKKLVDLVGLGNSSNSYFLYTPLLKKILEDAMLLTREKGLDEVGIPELVVASFEEEEGIGIKVFNSLGLDDEVIDMYYSKCVRKGKKEKKKLLVEEFGTDLTLKAELGEVDPVIGRDKEIKRIMEILCRRYKNNPILIGPAGVGKTAIVEELARNIVCGNVPDKLKNKRIIMVALSSLISNTKYRGEFEERVTKMLKELEHNDDIILFIDEIHTIMGAGGAEGAIDAANILKPALSRGKIKLIGATTLDEYKQSIEKDRAMDRRFQKVDVCETNRSETLNILRGLKNIYEDYHNVRIDDKLLEMIVDLSSKYLHNKYEPDRSIDILDEVCSKVSLNVTKINKKIENYKLELDSIRKEKRKYLIINDFDSAFKIREREKNIIKKINKLMNNSDKDFNIIKDEDIYDVVSSKSLIPVDRINTSNYDKYISNLDKYLHDKVVGQNEAIEELIKATKRMSYFKHSKPVSFLFTGSSGTGKTMLAIEYGKYLFNGNVVRFDGSEYKERESINKILGSPSGYIGYDDNKNKLEEIRNNPYSLVLFDEIEKACPDVLNLFLQILDEGKITDNKGNVIYFDNCVIIMTSNLGYNSESVGFVYDNKIKETSIKNFMSTELLNRINYTIYFNKMNYNNIYCILKKKIKSINNNLNTKITFSKKEIDKIIDDSKYIEYGARKIDRLVEDYVDNYIYNFSK